MKKNRQKGIINYHIKSISKTMKNKKQVIDYQVTNLIIGAIITVLFGLTITFTSNFEIIGKLILIGTTLALTTIFLLSARKLNKKNNS